jgi:hypothetical protein
MRVRSEKGCKLVDVGGFVGQGKQRLYGFKEEVKVDRTLTLPAKA